MKRIPPGVAATTPCLFATVCSAICLGAFLTAISASAAADAQITAKGLNPAEQWVVAQVMAGEIADLREQFPDEDKRKLSAHFLEDLLMGTPPGFKPHRNGVRINGAIIDQPINLTGAQIPCAVVLLNDCQFNTDVNFARASFAGNVSFENSAFMKEANFNGTNIRGVAAFQQTIFKGPVNFDSADIGSEFVAREAKFQNMEEWVSFNAMKVGRYAAFDKAVFEGSVDFTGADISGEFLASETEFQNKERGADFSGMKVGRFAAFDQAVFEGWVDFTGADFPGEFVAREAKFQNKERWARFNGMKVGRHAAFNNALFEGPVDFRYANFAGLDLLSASWPKVAGQLYMEGMTYKFIRAVLQNEPESHKALLKLADQSVYSADTYHNLEEFFLRGGFHDDADRAFIAGKLRERREHLHGLAWFGSLVVNLLSGYGRHTERLAIICVILVTLGCALFSPKAMELQKPENTPRVYNRFWYSLGLFLPFVDLQANKVWKPKQDQTFLRNYMRVHTLLGWILVPLVLAALTGLIK